MNYKMIGRIISFILLAEVIFMIPPLAISIYMQERAAAVGFLIAGGIGLSIAGLLLLLCRNPRPVFHASDGFISVGLGWISLSLVGCLPFWCSRAIPDFIDAVFEIVSGFTTTGASILTVIEGLPLSILYWRSFSHWLGGMGILVFILALAPAAERGNGASMHILRAESPGPEVGKLVPHIRETAMILYLIYMALTVLNVLFLLAGGMPIYDAVCTAYGTAGTGGFGIKNDSIAGYSPYLQNVCTVFMLLFGVNFTCYYLLLLRQVRSVLRDEELRLYGCLVLCSIVLITWNTLPLYDTLGETLRHAAFQVASIITTTGYATTDFDLWPSFSKAILLGLMFIGACAGSTGGGLKCGRLLLLMKNLRRIVGQVQNSNRVNVIRYNDRTIHETVLQNTSAYFFAYAAIIVVSFLLISLDGMSITTNFSAVVACFNNIGPGFEVVGPTGNYSAFSPLSKGVLILDMLAGRLEIFPILLLFSPSVLKRR